jgi:hypothetical protein
LKSSITEYRRDLKEYLTAYTGLQRSDAFINILATKIDKEILKELKLDSLLNDVVRKYPDVYIDNLFLVNLVTILEEFLKNRLVEEFEINQKAVTNFLLKYNVDKKLTTTDTINGPKKFAIELLNKVLFHNLAKVARIYLMSLDIDIIKLCDFKTLNLVVKLRHIIVHDGGKLKGEKLKLNHNHLLNYINEVNKFVENIDFFINNGRPKQRHRDIHLEIARQNKSLIHYQDAIDYRVEKRGL